MQDNLENMSEDTVQNGQPQKTSSNLMMTEKI